MENTIKIGALQYLSSAFGYFAEIINQYNPNPNGCIVKIITWDIEKFKNATCTIYNIEITKESDSFQFLSNVLEKKPHVFQVSKNQKKQSFFNSCKADDVFLGKDCVPTLFLISTPTIEDNNEEYDLIVLSDEQMFIEGFEEGIDATEDNLRKY